MRNPVEAGEIYIRQGIAPLKSQLDLKPAGAYVKENVVIKNIAYWKCRSVWQIALFWSFHKAYKNAMYMSPIA